MRIGAVRDVVLARVPLADHRTLGYTCKALRRLVYSDDFAKLRKTLGCEEFGLLALARPRAAGEDPYHTFACLTHKLESLGFQPPETETIPGDLDEFATALSTDGRLVVCGDASYNRNVLIYDPREYAWVQDSRFPKRLPVVMYGQCLAFLDNTLVVVGGGTMDEDKPWGFSWDEQLRIWQSLPPLPHAVTYAGYCAIGSRLFVVGGHARDEPRSDHYTVHNFGYASTDYTACLQIYDASRQSWSLGPPLAQLEERREEVISAVAYRGCVYVFSKIAHMLFGHVDDQFHMRFLGLISTQCHAYCFDPRSNSWSELPPLPIHGLSEFKACVHAGSLVFAGTDRSIYHRSPQYRDLYDGPPSTFMYAWDERAETWKARPLVRRLRWLDGILESLVSVPLRIR